MIIRKCPQMPVRVPVGRGPGRAAASFDRSVCLPEQRLRHRGRAAVGWRGAAGVPAHAPALRPPGPRASGRPMVPHDRPRRLAHAPGAPLGTVGLASHLQELVLPARGPASPLLQGRPRSGARAARAPRRLTVNLSCRAVCRARRRLTAGSSVFPSGLPRQPPCC